MGGGGGLLKEMSSGRWSTARPVRGAFPLAVDRENNLVLHAACATVWRRVEGGSAATETVASTASAYVPRCVCALSFDPLFDTLRAVALARGGFPEAGRALMLTGKAAAAGGVVGAVETGGAPRNGGGSGGGGGASFRPTPRSAFGKLGRFSGGSGGSDGASAGFEGKEAVAVKWGLGDAATLQAAPPPLPILPPPPPRPAPTLPSLFAPAMLERLPPVAPPPLVQSVSAPESLGGWSVGVSSEGEGRGGVRGCRREVGGGGWSSFGLPPLKPLDHPVEPLFQVCGVGG